MRGLVRYTNKFGISEFTTKSIIFAHYNQLFKIIKKRPGATNTGAQVITPGKPI